MILGHELVFVIDTLSNLLDFYSTKQHKYEQVREIDTSIQLSTSTVKPRIVHIFKL